MKSTVVNYSTRTRAVISSVALTIIFAVYHQYFYFISSPHDSLPIFYFPLLYSIIGVCFLSWVVGFRFFMKQFVSVCGYYCVTIFIATLFFDLAITVQTAVAKVTTLSLAVLIVFVVNYLIILMMNIVHYSYFHPIPLGQAARTASYIICLIALYFAAITISSAGLGFFARSLLLFSLTGFYSFALLDPIFEENYKVSIYSLANALCIFLFSFVLSFWPITSEVFAIIMSLLFYISLGITIEMKEKMSNYIWMEYIALMISIVLTLFFVANWGINGHII